MTVQELIDALLEYHPSTKVVVNGYEDGCDDIRQIRKINIEININKSKKYWEGDYNFSVDSSSEEAILLQRS